MHWNIQHKAMVKIFLFAVFSLLTTGFASVLAAELKNMPSDSEIRQQVVGTWTVDMPPIKGTVTIVSDGHFISQGTINLANDTLNIRYEGSWRIEDETLIEEITKSDSELLPVGHITRDKIIHINDKELVYLTKSGKTITRERSK